MQALLHLPGATLSSRATQPPTPHSSSHPSPPHPLSPPSTIITARVHPFHCNASHLILINVSSAAGTGWIQMKRSAHSSPITPHCLHCPAPLTHPSAPCLRKPPPPFSSPVLHLCFSSTSWSLSGVCASFPYKKVTSTAKGNAAVRKDVECGLTSRHHLKSAVIGPWTHALAHTHTCKCTRAHHFLSAQQIRNFLPVECWRWNTHTRTQEPLLRRETWDEVWLNQPLERVTTIMWNINVLFTLCALLLWFSKPVMWWIWWTKFIKKKKKKMVVCDWILTF